MKLCNRISMVMLTIVMSTVLSCASAQADNPLQKEVEAATKALTEAFLKPDASVLNKLAAEQLTYGHSSGKIENKEQFVQTLVSGASVFEDIQISEQTVAVQGETAIVRHVMTAKTNDPGKGPANIRLGIMLTWVKADSGWQLLARQAYKL